MKLESLLKKVYLLIKEIIIAVENDSKRYAIRKKVELERMAYISTKILNADKLSCKDV